MVETKKRRPGTAQFLELDIRRVTPAEAAARFAERDARAALDTRSPVQRLLGDPPPRVSIAPTSVQARHGGQRVDLWAMAQHRKR